METYQLVINSGVTAGLIGIFGWFVRKWMSSIEITLSKLQETVAQIDKAVSVMQAQNVSIGRELGAINKWLDEHDQQLKKHSEQIVRLEENVKKK